MVSLIMQFIKYVRLKTKTRVRMSSYPCSSNSLSSESEMCKKEKKDYWLGFFQLAKTKKERHTLDINELLLLQYKDIERLARYLMGKLFFLKYKELT